MEKQLLDKYVSLELSLKVFKLDRAKFVDMKKSRVYVKKLDAVIEQIQKDLIQFKGDLMRKYDLSIKRIDKFNYSVNGEVYSYKSEELKDMTEKVMAGYLMGLEEE